MMKPFAQFLFAAAALALALAPCPARAGVEMVKPPADKALVCFYREVTFHGNWFKYSLTDGEKRVGAMPSESYLFYLADPGDHSFGVGLVRHGQLKLHLEGGHIYYLRCEPAPEIFYEQPEVELMPAAEGAAVVATLRPSLADQADDGQAVR